MLYNFTFEEAMKVLYNEEGWVQGERFGKNTYIAYDKKEDCFVLNAVNAEDHVDPKLSDSTLAVWGSISDIMDCQHFFRQIFLGYFSDIVQAFDTLRKNVCGDDYTSLHNPIVLSSVLPAYGMFHSIQILFL